MRAKNFDIQVVIDDLQGTCDTLQGGIENHYPDMTEDDLTEDDHTILNNQIFLCDTCGWWCEISEQCNENPECGGSDCTDCCEPSHDEDE